MSVYQFGSIRVGDSKKNSTRDSPLLLNSLLDDNRFSNLPTVHEESETSVFSSLHRNFKVDSRLDESSIVDPHILIEDKENAKSDFTGKLLERQANNYNRTLLALHTEHNSYRKASEKTIHQLKLEVFTIKRTQETELAKFKTQVVRALRSELSEVKSGFAARSGAYSALRRENKQLRGELSRLWKDYGRDKVELAI